MFAKLLLVPDRIEEFHSLEEKPHHLLGSHISGAPLLQMSKKRYFTNSHLTINSSRSLRSLGRAKARTLT